MGPFEAPEAEGEFDLAHGPGGLRTRRQRGGRRFGPKKTVIFTGFYGMDMTGKWWTMMLKVAILMVI
jgi:hypothetical protein